MLNYHGGAIHSIYKVQQLETKARLEDGSIVVYHFCDEHEDNELSHRRKYLGKGVIYSVGDTIQEPDNPEILHFWGFKQRY